VAALHRRRAFAASIFRNNAPRHARARMPGGVATLGATVADATLIVIFVLIFQLFLRTFVVQLYLVPSISMENTLKIGDVLVVSRVTPRFTSLARGDAVVFRDPGGWLDPVSKHNSAITSAVESGMAFVGLLPRGSNEHLVKRVIGLAGDVVACDSKSVLTVNETRVVEPYLFPGDRACSVPFRVIVPANSIWVLGDHRSRSADSRYHRDNNDGAVPVSSVVGRVVGVSSNGHLRGL
jgi:signal peptidase I